MKSKAKVGCFWNKSFLLATILMVAVTQVALGARNRARAEAKAPVAAKSTGYADVNCEALRLAIQDLAKSPASQYPGSGEFLERLEAIEKKLAENADDAEAKAAFARLRREALSANPLLNFDRLLVVKRAVAKGKNLGLPQNWQGNCALPRNGYENEIAVLSPVAQGGTLTTLYKPASPVFVGDLDLHFDADRMLFSSIGEDKRWHVFEMDAEGKAVRQVTPVEPEVDWYDACYLPNDDLMVDSTAAFHGVPCVGGNNTVANLFRISADGKTIRQLCFDQDHDWCPTVLNDGRVLYTRWEYSDTPHYFTRILFRMNPDGTGQMEHYGSSSYWPNSIFYARPVPDHPSQLVAIISGHHGVPRMGELVLFDPAKARFESSGAVQRIPGRNQPVPPDIKDGLVQNSWPKFLHPYPLSSKYFLVSMQNNPQSSWGIYLVDVFDNCLLLAEEPGFALLEPVPFRKTPRPPVIPDRVKPESREALVQVSDIYAGNAMAGVPRGTVKALRVYEFHYAYPKMGGHINIGVDGPWDARRIHGTVPVYADGSANFRVPANVPLALQPLDAEGRAVQVMRSWFAAMPGEVVSCSGCHESQNSTSLRAQTIAATQPPADIAPWHGPARGFSFKREVQPVLDRFCVGCHDGQEKPGGPPASLNLTAQEKKGWRGFTPSYLALHPYVRRPGPESDYHVQVPLEWHANTSELVQMLKKGHHNVVLDAEAWDRLYTWIDLNVPDHGTWTEHRKIASSYHQLRMDMRAKYANRPEDPELVPDPKRDPISFVKPAPVAARPEVKPQVAGWPFDAAEAKRRQAAGGLPGKIAIDLGDNVTLDLVLVPAGEFIMGAADGLADEFPPTPVKIAKPFYLGAFEVTFEQYRQFDSAHANGVFSVFNKDQGNRGEIAERPRQPVIRVSWQRAMDFCYWLSQKTGRAFSLPTEAQWEYACRAGTDSALNYGSVDTDFGKLANLADARVLALCRRDSPKWIPAVTNCNDGAIVTEQVGKYAPNAWGLHDMHGNVWEWTASAYQPYPYVAGDGREKPEVPGFKVIRGGSFYDRPQRARSSCRLSYPEWQRVFNVGFRVVCEAKPGTTGVQTAAAK